MYFIHEMPSMPLPTTPHIISTQKFATLLVKFYDIFQVSTTCSKHGSSKILLSKCWILHFFGRKHTLYLLLSAWIDSPGQKSP